MKSKDFSCGPAGCAERSLGCDCRPGSESPPWTQQPEGAPSMWAHLNMKSSHPTDPSIAEYTALAPQVVCHLSESPLQPCRSGTADRDFSRHNAILLRPRGPASFRSKHMRMPACQWQSIKFQVLHTAAGCFRGTPRFAQEGHIIVLVIRGPA